MGYKIAIIAGDGIGPEVINEGVKVIEAVCDKENINVEWHRRDDIRAERYLEEKKTLTDDDLKELGKFKTIYFGSIGDPRVKPGILELGIIIKLRQHFGQYVNLRPIKLYPNVPCPLKDKKAEDIDFVVVRENTEGLYCGKGSFSEKGTKNEVATQTSINTRKGVERVIRYAYEICQKRNKMNKLTLVDKANVLAYEGDLWRRVFNELGKEYSKIEKSFEYIDATTMYFVRNPEWYDVIVTNNMFGDIITDLGAMLQGGLGMAPGGNINPEGTSMFEPIHGSAPPLKGKNVANPIASILAGGMMLEFLGEKKATDVIDKAVIEILKEGKTRTEDIGGSSKTNEIGNEVVKKINDM